MLPEECEDAVKEAFSERDAVISAANVLMVALLKMNRLFIPAFLRWRRAVRWRQIQNARADLERRRAQENHEHARHQLRVERARSGHPPPGFVTQLADRLMPGRAPPPPSRPQPPAAGPPPPRPRRGRSRGGPHPRVAEEPPLEQQGLLAAEHVQAEVGDEGDEIRPEDDLAPLPPPRSRSSSGSFTSPTSSEDAPQTVDDFERRVRLLQLQRAQDVYMGVYTSVGTIFITVASIVVYSTVIISLVLALFPFDRGQSIIFAFSLIATALVSESEVLRRGKTDDERKKQKETAATDLKNFRYKADAPTTMAPRDDVAVDMDVEDFSDLD